MTEKESRREWEVAYQTALGRMCGAGEPTAEQIRVAKQEADEHVAACEDYEGPP